MSFTLPAWPARSTRPLTRFALPPGSEAAEPPEQRGLARDEVRLLVAGPEAVEHERFRDLPEHLTAGDLVVVNTSATLPAALAVWRRTDPRALMHVAAELDDGAWVVELRRPDNGGPAEDVVVGEQIALAGGRRLAIESSYPHRGRSASRLWRAVLDRAVNHVEFLRDHGQPIRYGYVSRRWPLSDVQTVYADEPGSAEMPSAGRPFSDCVLTGLMMRGVAVAPLVLHTGVSSPEKHEPPAPERYRVPPATARLVNHTRESGGRVVAVGTTVVRALESAADPSGTTHASAGWTALVIGPQRPVRVVNGLISGLHEPEASHLLLLEAVAGASLVRRAYDAAVREGYRWHEFGDSMLFLPQKRIRPTG